MPLKLEEKCSTRDPLYKKWLERDRSLPADLFEMMVLVEKAFFIRERTHPNNFGHDELQKVSVYDGSIKRIANGEYHQSEVFSDLKSIAQYLLDRKRLNGNLPARP